MKQMLFMRLYIDFTGRNTREVLKNFRPESSSCVLDSFVLLQLETGILIYWSGSLPAVDEYI